VGVQQHASEKKILIANVQTIKERGEIETYIP
jgi:hypothetical protein